MTLLAILLLSILPARYIERQEHEVIHRNHLYDGSGKLVFVQYGGLDWCWETEGFRWQWFVVDRPGRVCLDRQRDVTLIRWNDGNLRREARAPLFIESHTQYDVELHDRQILPKGERMGLVKPLEDD